MRHSNTKERIQDRKEFVFMYRHEISDMIKFDDRYWGSPEALRFVDEVARPYLGYNPKTNSADIWNSLRKTLNQNKELCQSVN